MHYMLNYGENIGLIGPSGRFYGISGYKTAIEISKILHFWQIWDRQDNPQVNCAE